VKPVALRVKRGGEGERHWAGCGWDGALAAVAGWDGPGRRRGERCCVGGVTVIRGDASAG
jgi:hypothetical protein